MERIGAIVMGFILLILAGITFYGAAQKLKAGAPFDETTVFILIGAGVVILFISLIILGTQIVPDNLLFKKFMLAYFAVVIVMISLAIAGVAAHDLKRLIPLLAFGSQGEGRVTGFNFHDSSGSRWMSHEERIKKSRTTSYPVITFISKNGELTRFESEVGHYPVVLKQGQVVPILYDPRHPQDAIIHTFRDAYFRPILTLLVGGLIFLGGMGLCRLLWSFVTKVSG